MKVAVDLHIHSALSPCAMDDMTPNNIINMALLKGLDAIAITDHNCCDNVGAAIKTAEGRIIIVPGMEVQTREEIHILCYFPTLERLLNFDFLIKSRLPEMENTPEIFGRQLIIDSRDHVVGERTQMLLVSVDLSIDEILHEVEIREGVVIPAHINRQSFSLISQLGFIPHEFNNGMLEVDKALNGYPPNIPKERLIYFSDAHNLGKILERESFLEIDKLSIEGIIGELGKKW